MTRSSRAGTDKMGLRLSHHVDHLSKVMRNSSIMGGSAEIIRQALEGGQVKHELRSTNLHESCAEGRILEETDKE